MRHARRGCCSVPVLLPRRNVHHIALTELLHWAAPLLHPAGASGYDESLPERMRVPGRPGTGLKGDAGSR